MKRRNFLQGLVAAPIVAKAVNIEASIPETPIGWASTIYEYGAFGVLSVEITTENPQEYTIKTFYPENDWLNECQTINEMTYGSYKAHCFSATGQPSVICAPVNELTKVEVYENDILLDSGMVKYDPEMEWHSFYGKQKGMFIPWKYNR